MVVPPRTGRPLVGSVRGAGRSCRGPPGRWRATRAAGSCGWPVMRWSSTSAARDPSARIGWRTVVRAGRAWRAAMTSSQPVIAMSRPTRRPTSSAATMAPSAISSLAQTRASGRSRACEQAGGDARARRLVEQAGRHGRLDAVRAEALADRRATARRRRGTPRASRGTRRGAARARRGARRARGPAVRPSARTESTSPTSGRATTTTGRPSAELGDDLVGDRAAEQDEPVDAPGEVAHGRRRGRAGRGWPGRGRCGRAARRSPRTRAAPRRSTGRTGRGRRSRWRRACARRARCPRGWGGSRAPRRRRAPWPGSPRRRAPTRSGPGRRSRSRRRHARRRRRSSPCPSRAPEGVGSAFMW